jgi:hypothetical protein
MTVKLNKEMWYRISHIVSGGCRRTIILVSVKKVLREKVGSSGTGFVIGNFCLVSSV